MKTRAKTARGHSMPSQVHVCNGLVHPAGESMFPGNELANFGWDNRDKYRPGQSPEHGENITRPLQAVLHIAC